MDILICDLNVKLDGHKFGFIQNLINCSALSETKNNFYVLTNNSSEFSFSTPKDSKIEILEISNIEQQTSDSQDSYYNKSKYQWKLIDQYSKQVGIDRLILMELDPYQLFIGSTKTNYEISGIWFRPFHRMKATKGSILSSVKFQINQIKKIVTFKVCLLNKKVKKVFVLNDELLPGLNKERVYYLPDPCFEYPQLDSFDLRKRYGIPVGNLILLQFGFIDERKNTENIIEALHQIDIEHASKITLLIIGKFKDGYLQILKDLLSSKANFHFAIRDEFIPDQEMESTFSQADVILRTNIDFFGSSGVVGIAANHNKPCIVSNFGVMAEQVIKYKMGEVIDPYNTFQIKCRILNYLQDSRSRTVNGSYYKEQHSVEQFVKTLLEIQ